MKVIGHQAKAKNLHGLTFFGFLQERQECFVVLEFVKYGCATIAAVNNVIGVAASLSSWDLRHAWLLTCALLIYQTEKVACPLFLLPFSPSVR